MDIGILFNLATDDACIYRKQNPQRVRLKDLSALWTCSPGYREPLVLWPQGGVFVLPCPFHKADFNRSDSLQCFPREVSPALSSGLRFHAAFLVCPIQHILQHSRIQVTDPAVTHHWQDVVLSELLHLLGIACAGGGPHRDQILVPDLQAALGGAANALIQPGICFCICFPLAGTTRLCAGERLAHPVLLHLDLPTVLVRQPLGGIGSSSHKKYTSMGTL